MTALLPYASTVVMVNARPLPAVVGPDRLPMTALAGAAITATVALPARLGSVVSAKVSVWLPAVRSVADRDTAPPDAAVSLLSVAALSVEVRWTVPTYVDTGFLYWSAPWTVNDDAEPACGVLGSPF